jgi:purine-binding chemotaxis protein CheW
MSQELREDTPWVIFRLGNQPFGLSAFHTREMLALPEVTPIPRAPDYIRGVINLRGEVITLVDLRLRLGMPSNQVEKGELIKLLEQREQDHKNWLGELESSVREKRTFQLTTDPHACAFGRWYDNYHTEDLKLGSLLRMFDNPHKRIHAIGIEARELMDKGLTEAALEVINRTRQGALSRMVSLFAEAREAIRMSRNEIAVVVEHQGMTVALTVDAVDSVEDLASGSFEPVPAGQGNSFDNLVTHLGKRQESQEMVLLLDVTSLLAQTQGVRRQ